MEAAQAVAIVRGHAKEWNVDGEKIVIGGFSAGPHGLGLASYETANTNCQYLIQTECQSWIDMFSLWLSNL